MKRPLCLILAPLLLAALLCACASPSGVQDYPPVEGLAATVVEASPEGLIVLFENDTRMEYLYGQAYTPERRLRGGAWTPIAPRKGVMLVYDSIGYIIPPGGAGAERGGQQRENEQRRDRNGDPSFFHVGRLLSVGRFGGARILSLF